MALSTPANDAGASKRLAIGLLESAASLLSLCAKQASRASRKLARNSRTVPGSPSTRPKQLLATISNKVIPFRRKKRIGGELKGDEGFGDGGLWQRSILMGDKCQPLAFSGVIYYDSNGKRLSELPARSPRASPLPSYAYPAAKQE